MEAHPTSSRCAEKSFPKKSAVKTIPSRAKVSSRRHVLEESVLQEPVTIIAARDPLLLSPDTKVCVAIRVMQEQHCGSIVLTEDGTAETPVVGIFTERDVLNRVIDCGRALDAVSLREVMTPEPEVLPCDSSIALLLNRMSVFGIRHVPIVDEAGRPQFVLSVRDVVDLLVESFPRAILNLPTNGQPSSNPTREGA